MYQSGEVLVLAITHIIAYLYFTSPVILFLEIDNKINLLLNKKLILEIYTLCTYTYASTNTLVIAIIYTKISLSFIKESFKNILNRTYTYILMLSTHMK